MEYRILGRTGLRVSAVVSADSILQSRAAQSGQDMAVFPKLFDLSLIHI